ncbi:hypothetical protein [Armatimonas sp.]|uniref:hypothetical protein n=1 Tax=Armatimonas sp. TaxID=1872638 RepID=UPI00286C788F|nr:hypothetical protein [Armatimonas sp.]
MPRNLYRPGRIEFPELVKLSPLILLGQVELVTNLDLALIEVKEAFKGRPARYLPFHVRTDRNRVFELSPGRECLFFMEPDEEEPTHYVDVWSGRGVMPITQRGQKQIVEIFTATVIMDKKIKVLEPGPQSTTSFFAYREIVRAIRHHNHR